MPPDHPTPELLRESLDDQYVATSLQRVYSSPGLPPILTRFHLPAIGTGSAHIQTLGPDGEWRHLLSVNGIPVPDDHGEAECDRLAALAVRLLAEAKAAGGDTDE